MNTARILGLPLVLTSAVGAASAQDTLTRDRVRTETHAAQIAGDIPQGDIGQTLAQLNPPRYAAARVRDGEARHAMN